MSEGQKSWIGELKDRLAEPPPRRLPADGKRQSAVLVPLYVDAGALWVQLVQRSSEQRHHPSQNAFPGGALETGESVWDAALRESREEIGLDENQVLRIGELDEVETPSGYRTVPCVGALPTGFVVDPSGGEVDETFAVPLVALANPRLVEHRQVRIDQAVRELTIYHVGNRTIWGMTALVLENLLARLGITGQHFE